MDIPAHRAFRIRAFVEMEQVSVLYCSDCLIHIVKGDFRQVPRQLDAACASCHVDQSGVFELRQDLPDDDRVGVDRAGKKVAGDLVFILEHIHAGENVQGDCKPA